MVKRLPAMQESRVRFLGREDPLEKEMAIHSSTLAWKIPWMEEPDRLQSMGSQRVRHDWETSLSLRFWQVVKGGAHDGISVLMRRGRNQAVFLSASCEYSICNQVESLHQTLDWSWTPSLQNVRIKCLLCKPPSLWYFVMVYGSLRHTPFPSPSQTLKLYFLQKHLYYIEPLSQYLYIH